MKRWQWILTGLCTLVVAVSSDLRAETLKFAFSSGKPAPYVIDDTRGIEVEIVTQAFSAVGIEVTPVWFTYKRMAYMRQMGFQGRGVTKPQEGNGLFYSEPYIYYQDVALTRKESNIKLDSVRDMAGYRVGAWQTGAQDIGGEFEVLFGGKGESAESYFPVFDDYRRVRMLWMGRLDIVVTDLLIFDHFTMKQSQESGRELSYDVHWLWGKKHWFYSAFKSKSHRDLFNKGLARIKSQGIMDAIYRKYGVGSNWSPENTRVLKQ